MFGKRDELLTFWKSVADKHVGRDRFLWRTRIVRAAFDGEHWSLYRDDGALVVVARFLIPAIYSISAKHPIVRPSFGQRPCPANAPLAHLAASSRHSSLTWPTATPLRATLRTPRSSAAR